MECFPVASDGLAALDMPVPLASLTFCLFPTSAVRIGSPAAYSYSKKDVPRYQIVSSASRQELPYADVSWRQLLCERLHRTQPAAKLPRKFASTHTAVPIHIPIAEL